MSICKNCCENVLKVTSVEPSATDFLLITESTITPKNGCHYVIVIPCGVIESIKSTAPVSIVVNGNPIPITDRKLGNLLNADQLRFICQDRCGNRILRVVFGANLEHFKIISQDLPQSTVLGV